MSSSSRIPVSIKSQRTTPRRQKPRRTLSVGSPARSTGSSRLSAIIQQHKETMGSFVLSPLTKRQSVLSDNTDIVEPRRKSWWNDLGDTSKDTMEVLKDKNFVETNNIIEDLDMEVLSQEKKQYTLDLPESSDNETINSIVIPQRILFAQKENHPQTKFGDIINTRDTLAKLHKSNIAASDKTSNAGTKQLFTNKPRSKPIFPAELLNISPIKTTANRTREHIEPKAQIRTIFGNRQGTKRKNMFANFIVSDSEDEIPEIQPKVFGFHKKPDAKKRDSSVSRGMREPSPTSSLTEFDDWNLLPSSTMVDNQLEAMISDGHTPKRARLSKLSEAKESEAASNSSGTTNQTKQSNRNNNSRTKQRKSNNSNTTILKKNHESEKTKLKENESGKIDTNAEKEPMQVECENEQIETERYEKELEDQIERSEVKNEPTRSKSKCNVQTEFENEIEVADLEFVMEEAEVEGNIEKEKNESKEFELESKEDQQKMIRQEAQLIENSGFSNSNNTNVQNKPNKSKETQVQYELNKSKEAKIKNIIVTENNQSKNVEVECPFKNTQNATNQSDAESEKEQQQMLNSEPQQKHFSNCNNTNVGYDQKLLGQKNKSEEAEVESKDQEHENEQNESKEPAVESDVDNEEIDNEPNGSKLTQIDSEVENQQNESKGTEVESEDEEQNESKQTEIESEVDNEDIENEPNESKLIEIESEVENQQNEETDENESENEEQNESKQNEIESEVKDIQNESQEAGAESEVDNEDEEVENNHSDMESEDEEVENEQIVQSVHSELENEQIKSNVTEVESEREEQLIVDQEPRARESIGFSDGSNSNAGSGWDSHRTTRKTLRQTFGKDFTPRKSLRALVMEKSAKRQTAYNNMSLISMKQPPIPIGNSTEIPEFCDRPDDFVDENLQSDHEASRRMRQTTLEMYLEKIKQQNMEKNKQIEAAVRKSLAAPSKEQHVFKVPTRPMFLQRAVTKTVKPKAKQRSFTTLIGELPEEVIEDLKYKPPKRFRPSNAPWITKRLYKYFENKLEPKYDYKARLRAEKLVEMIYQFVKELRRQSVAPAAAVNELKQEMARLNILETHFQFYEFFHQYMPREVRIKVVPDIINKIPLPRHGVFAKILQEQR